MTVVAVVGLGCVGLPLAVEFGKKFETIGFDLSDSKIASYKNYCDPTGEVSAEDLKAATRAEREHRRQYDFQSRFHHHRRAHSG